MAKPIKNFVKDILDQNNNDKSWQIFLLSNWNSIIGKLSNKVKLEKIYNDTLVLGVYDSCWMQELFLLSNAIIIQINAKLDKPRIKSLRFKKIEHKKQQTKNIKTKKIYKDVELTQKEMQSLTNIKDEQLQQELKRFLIRCYQET